MEEGLPVSRITIIGAPRHMTGGLYGRTIPHSMLDSAHRNSEHVSLSSLDAPEFVPTGSSCAQATTIIGGRVAHVLVLPSVTFREFT
jgi:hypothetical protein